MTYVTQSSPAINDEYSALSQLPG